MRFTIGKKVNVENSRVVISGQAALKAEIFVSENDELKSLKEISKNKDERTEISLQGFVTGSYVIKISQTQKTSENNVTVSYSITLDLDKGENNIIKKE